MNPPLPTNHFAHANAGPNALDRNKGDGTVTTGTESDSVGVQFSFAFMSVYVRPKNLPPTTRASSPGVGGPPLLPDFSQRGGARGPRRLSNSPGCIMKPLKETYLCWEVAP